MPWLVRLNFETVRIPGVSRAAYNLQMTTGEGKRVDNSLKILYQ